MQLPAQFKTATAHPLFTPVRGGLLQRKGRNSQLGTRNDSAVPPIVHEVLRSPGLPLDAGTRAFMEPRFGHDFSHIRLHTDAKAAESASAIRARAYAVGDHIVFGWRQFPTTSPEGLRLFAHELAHVVQQSQSGVSLSQESRAEAAAGRVAMGESVSPETLGGAPVGLWAQSEDREKRLRTPLTAPLTLTLPWASALGAPPVASPGPLTLGQPGTGAIPLLRPPSLAPSGPLVPRLPGPGRGQPTPPGTGALTSDPSSGTSQPQAEPPSRLPLVTSGRFSLGLRLGFPEAEARELPGAPPSAIAESLQRAEFMNQMITGTVPEGWEAVDKAKLAKAVWGIFSTHIAPDVARKITSGLSTPTASGTSYQLDLVLLTDFSGGGLSFTVQF